MWILIKNIHIYMKKVKLKLNLQAKLKAIIIVSKEGKYGDTRNGTTNK
jgi:hypothetical protein